MSENQTAVKQKRNFGPKEPVAVSESQILAWLDEGNDRMAIAKKLGVNLVQINALFKSSPVLAGKKTKRNPLNVFTFTKDVSAGSNSATNTVDSATGGSTTLVNDGTQVAEKEAAGAWD